MQPKLIVLDLNHTLIRDNSWRNLNLAMGITPEEDATLMARAARGEITDAEGQAWLLQRYQQRGDCHREAVQCVLSQYTYMPYAQMVVAALQARGYRVAINSGAMDIVVGMVVGDGANDLPLFAATGNGVAFAGSPAARHARWGIADLRDVLTIVE